MGRHRPRKGLSVKKSRVAARPSAGETSEGPSTFVFQRGKVSKNVQQLVRDMRRVMEPFTASRLQVRKTNIIKDFVSAAGIFNVSHLVAFTQTDTAIYMRLIRMPRGPTLTFRICSYALNRDVTASLKEPHMDPKQFLYHPLVVLNNFSGEGMEFKLMASMFQNMFPSINVGKVNLNHLRRCVVLNYNSEDKTIDFTHCNIQVSPAGISKPVKKLLKSKVPDMSKYSDISDFVMRDGNMSESEGEMDGPINEVTLPQKLSSRGNLESTKSAIRMNEIGPRMTMKLHKIEEGVCDGEVLFHDVFHKTEEEIQKLKKDKEIKKKTKEERRKHQEANVKRKEMLKKKKEKKRETSKDEEPVDEVEDDEFENDASKADPEVSEDDDKEYFEKEVGVAPDPDIFNKTRKRKTKSFGYRNKVKRTKPERSTEDKTGRNKPKHLPKKNFKKFSKSSNKSRRQKH